MNIDSQLFVFVPVAVHRPPLPGGRQRRPTLRRPRASTPCAGPVSVFASLVNPLPAAAPPHICVRSTCQICIFHRNICFHCRRITTRLLGESEENPLETDTDTDTGQLHKMNWPRARSTNKSVVYLQVEVDALHVQHNKHSCGEKNTCEKINLTLQKLSETES